MADLLGYSATEMEQLFQLYAVDIVGKKRIKREVDGLRAVIEAEPEPEQEPEPSRVLVMGGFDGSDRLNTAELYDRITLSLAASPSAMSGKESKPKARKASQVDDPELLEAEVTAAQYERAQKERAAKIAGRTNTVVALPGDGLTVIERVKKNREQKQISEGIPQQTGGSSGPEWCKFRNCTKRGCRYRHK